MMEDAINDTQTNNDPLTEMLAARDQKIKDILKIVDGMKVSYAKSILEGALRSIERTSFVSIGD